MNYVSTPSSSDSIFDTSISEDEIIEENINDEPVSGYKSGISDFNSRSMFNPDTFIDSNSNSITPIYESKKSTSMSRVASKTKIKKLWVNYLLSRDEETPKTISEILKCVS